MLKETSFPDVFCDPLDQNGVDFALTGSNQSPCYRQICMLSENNNEVIIVSEVTEGFSSIENDSSFFENRDSHSFGVSAERWSVSSEENNAVYKVSTCKEGRLCFAEEVPRDCGRNLTDQNTTDEAAWEQILQESKLGELEQDSIWADQFIDYGTRTLCPETYHTFPTYPEQIPHWQNQDSTHWSIQPRHEWKGVLDYSYHRKDSAIPIHQPITAEPMLKCYMNGSGNADFSWSPEAMPVSKSQDSLERETIEEVIKRNALPSIVSMILHTGQPSKHSPTRKTDPSYNYCKVVKSQFGKRKAVYGTDGTRTSFCNVCTSFSNSSHSRGLKEFMRRHLFSHMKRNPHCCAICMKCETTNPGKVRAHIKRRHPEVLPHAVDQYLVNRIPDMDAELSSLAKRCYAL